MKRAAGVYSVGGQLLIVSAPETTVGIDTISGLVCLSAEAGREVIGANIQQALARCEDVVEAPTEAEWRASYDALLAASGIADLKAFMFAATMFYISVEGEGPIRIERVEKPAANNLIVVQQGDDGFLGTDIGMVMAEAIERLQVSRC